MRLAARLARPLGPEDRARASLHLLDWTVKIKGINLFPQAIGPILEEHPAFAGEFICKARRDAAGG